METQWEELRESCLACQNCDLCKTRTNLVFGTGPCHAEVMIVGEGPGRMEDEQGQPFVGRSGQLLDVFLDTIHLHREKNVFITNIVKCRPPENRDPLPEERQACLPWLRQQFRLIRPKLVVCMGRIASQQMIRPDYSVTREHGQWVEKNGILFMGTLHPAALLRNPKQKPMAFEDYRGLREKIKETCEHTYAPAE